MEKKKLTEINNMCDIGSVATEVKDMLYECIGKRFEEKGGKDISGLSYEDYDYIISHLMSINSWLTLGSYDMAER